MLRKFGAGWFIDYALELSLLVIVFGGMRPVALHVGINDVF